MGRETSLEHRGGKGTAIGLVSVIGSAQDGSHH